MDHKTIVFLVDKRMRDPSNSIQDEKDEDEYDDEYEYISAIRIYDEDFD